jgi:hypothetical protein
MMINLWTPEDVPPELKRVLDDVANVTPSEQRALRPLSWGYRLAQRVLPEVAQRWLAAQNVSWGVYAN